METTTPTAPETGLETTGLKTDQHMARNWRDLIRPRTLEIVEKTGTFGKFSCEPLERGFGTTLGNSLRRILLSSLQGAAITHVKIAGALHEFTSLPNIVEDVTERKRSRRALIESEQRFRAIFDQEFQHVGLLNRDGTILEMNRTALKAIGASAEDVRAALAEGESGGWWRRRLDRPQLAGRPMHVALSGDALPLVGRAAELERLVRAAEAALAEGQGSAGPQGGVLRLDGPDGSGKTRLMTEFGARFRLRRVPPIVLHGRCPHFAQGSFSQTQGCSPHVGHSSGGGVTHAHGRSPHVGQGSSASGSPSHSGSWKCWCAFTKS